MTVKTFAESNSLGVDKVLNLCQKLGIDVENESDSLSEDDQMLLEYELEELENANSGADVAGGGGGSSSGSKKKKSDSDGSDFHIDNETFSAAYKCLVDAVNMLENGLGDLSGLNQNGKNLIGSTDNDATIYNANLASINELSRGLQNQMTNTIILLSRMNYKNANYFKDTLGDLLKDGKSDLNDYMASDEYKADLKIQEEYEKYKDEIDTYYRLLNGGLLAETNPMGTPFFDGDVGYIYQDIDKMKAQAERLGISDVGIIQDLISKMDNYNKFFSYASSDANVVASTYGLATMSNVGGLIDKAAEYGLSGDLTIQNFINQSDDNNKKIEDEEEKILDSYAKENYFDNFDELNSFYEEKIGKSYFEFFETLNLNDETMIDYYDKLYSIDTNEDATLKSLIENYLTVENKDLSLIDYAKMTTAGYSYSSDGKKKTFCSLLEMIPTYADNNSVEEISFYDILSGSSKFQHLCNVTENATVESYIGDVVEIYDSLNFNVNSEIEKLNLEYKDALLLNSELQITKFEIDTNLRDYQRRTQLINSSDFLDNKNVRDVDTIKSNVDNILDRSVINYVNVSLSDSGAKKTGNINLSDDELYQLAYASANGIGDIKIVENGIQMSDGTVLNCYGLSDKLRDDLGALGAQISVMTSNDPTLLDGGFKRITQDDYMLFSNDEVNSVIKSFKDRTENQVVNLVNVNNKRTVTATEEESMYLLNAYYNNIGDFELDGKNQLYYTNSDGVKIYIKSPDNILSTTLLTNSLNSNNVTSLLTNSVDWQKFTTNYNYLDEFNYIYNTSSVEDRITNIKEFFDDNARALDQRWVDLKTEIDKDFANRNPVVASINSVGLGPSEGLSTVIYAFEHLNDTTPVYRSQTYSTGDTYRSQVSSNIRESGVDGAGVSAFFYDVGMSMADNVFNAAVFGPNAVGLGLALSSFDNSYNDALDRGVNSNTAFWYSFASATLEAATEQFAFDHLREVTGLSSVDDVVGLKKVFFLDEQVDDMAENIMRKIAGNQLNPEDAYVSAKKIYSIFSQAGSEGMEEYVSSVGGRIIDDVFNGSLSAENIAYNNYIASGMSEEAAYAAVKRDNLTSDIISILSGAVSGGGMATGGSVVSSFTPSGQYLNTLYRSEYTGDYAPTINSLLNMSNIPLASKVLSAKVTINGLYSDGKIDLESKQKLDTIVQDYHNDNYKGEFSGEINDIAKQDEFYQISLYTEMKSRLESKGVKTDKLSFEKMQKKYQDDYNIVVESLKDMEIKISTDSILYGITKSNDVDLENFKLENREMFDSELKRITEDYSNGKEKISQLIYSIVNNKIFGSDSEKVALKLINKMNNKSEITSDQTILSSLVSGIGLVGINQENLLVYMNHQDLTINDIVVDDSLSFLSEQDRNARLAQILKNYLDQMVNTAKEQNNLSSEQQLRQEHISKNMENNEDKKSIRKDSTSDEKAAMIGKGETEGSGNDTDLKVNNNSEVVVEENKTEDNEKTSTIEISSNESTEKGQNCIRSLFSPKNSDNSVKTNRLRKKIIKQVVSAYKNIDSRLARDLLRRIDMSKSDGGTDGICGYYEVAKVIFRIFEGKEKLFKQKFGFSMYLNGDFNFEQLIVDLFVNNNNEKYVDELLSGKDVKYKALCDAVTDGRCFNIERICDYLKTKEIDISPSQFKEHQIFNSSDTDFKKMSSDDAKKVAIEIVSNVREQIKSGNQITISAMGIHSGKLDVASGKVVSDVNPLQLINVKTGESRSFSEGHVMSVRGIDSSGRLIVYTFNDLYAINLVDVLSKGNVFSINSLEIGQNILDGESSVEQSVSAEMGTEGSLTIDDDAVMSNGEEDFDDEFIELDDRYVVHNILINDNSVSELFNSIKESRYYNSQYKKEELLFGLVKAFKRDSSYAEAFSERYDVSREFYNMYLANRNNLNTDQEILEFVKNYVQENTKPGSKTDLSQFSLFDIMSPRNSNLYGVRHLRHNLINKLVSKVEGVTQKFMYRILSNIESGIVLDSKYTMITGYIFNKYDGNSKEFERIFGFPMYIDGGFNKTMLVADIYSYMLSSQYEGKSVSEIFSILMDSRGKLDVVDELISNYLIDRGIIDKKQEFIYKSILDSKTDFGDISNVNYIISNIISKISDSLSNGRKVIFSLESTNSLYVNSLSLKNIDDKSVIKVYSGEGLTIIGVLDNNKLVVENSGGKYYIDLKDILIFGKKFNINEIGFDLVATEDRNIKRLKSNSQFIVNNKKLTIDEFYEQFNNKDFNLGGFIIKGYEILDFASDERYLDRLLKPSSNGIVYGSYSAKDMIFGLVKLFQELDKNGISTNKLYPHIGKIYNEYKASSRKGLLNTDNDIRMFASNYAVRMGYLEGLKNNSQSKVVGMKEFGEEGNIDFQIADDFYDENIELTKEATEKLDNFMRNNGSFEVAFRVLKNAVRSKDFDSIPDVLKSHLSGLTYNQMKTYLKNKMSQIISDDISNFDLKSFFYKKNNVADSRAYVVITDNNMIMIPSNHGSISYNLGDIFEYLDQDFDSSKYTNEAMMRRNSGYIVIELQNKFIGGRNIIYSPDVISGNQYRMLQEFNQQIKELTSKDNLASLGFNLRGNNGSSLELVNVNNIDGIASKLLKRVENSEKREIREQMDKQQEIVEEISDENKTKVEEYDEPYDAVMSNGEEDIDEFEDDQFRFISDDRFFSSLFDGNGKYGIDQGLFRDLRKRNHPTYIEMKNVLINKYGFSQRDAIKVMKNLDVIGACNYAAQANIIVSSFKNMPNKFQELFGFPLYKYDSNGRMYINDAEILLDLYTWYNIISSEGELFITDKLGRTIFNKDAIKSRFGKIIMYKQRGGDNTNHNVFNEYLKSKSKDLSCVISEVSIDSVISNKKDYEVDGMTLVLGCAPSGNKPIIFEEIDIGIKYLSNGGHWTKITGVVDDGFIVSSRGKRCLVKFEDLRSNYHNIYFTKFNLENNNVLTVEEVMSNLFNIEDIRNNKKVVNMMDISKFRYNYTVDELKNILLSNRYSLSSKKAVSLALYLSSLNLDFYNIDCTYNSLIVKLFDKSLSSVDRLMTFELLRIISNEYSSFGSVQYLFDQQFIGVSESEILDLKTRNIQFDLNEFYSSNEGTVNNGATVFFTGNQVVNLLNDDHGEAGHSVTQYHIFSSIYGISLENDFASSFIYKNLESMIRVVLVSERGVSGYYIKFPSKISRKQFEMFKAYADKYGNTLSDISKGISDSGFRGLIYYTDGSYYSSESHNISDAVTFAETLIDDRYEMLDDRNIVGYTLDDLKNEDVSDDINEEYDDPYDRVMSNGEEDIDDGYELDDDESLRDVVGLQYFGGKNGSNSKSMNSIFGIMNKFFNKDNTDLYDMSNVEEIISKLFNIEDIRNNNNVVDIDNIKQFESMSVDELNSILMSKRYNLSQKKAVSLVLYLKSLNLGFKTDNIDFVYNSLVYKLSDKSLSSADKLRVFELLRTISNEFSEFDSVDELLDYQFNIPSESEILDVKTRNSKFDLNEFYSSNEFGHDNGAVIRFTDNQVVSVLNGNNGRGAHGFANENIISAIFGIEYVYQSKSFIDPFALSSSFLSSNSRNMIDVRLVSEYGYSLYSVDFPDKISRKQFELFKAYADKYGDTLRRISEDLTANNKTNGYDGLIGFIDKHNNVEVSTHDINDLVKYAETLIDDDYRLLEDRNIVGYTLDDLRGVNVSDDDEINEEYDDAVMSNGDEDIDDGFIELHDVETVGLLDSYVKKYRGGIASAISRLKLVNSSDSRLIPPNLRSLSSSTISSYVNHLLRSIIIDQNNRFNLDEFLSINVSDNNTRMFYVITPHQELMFSSKTDFGYEISFLDVMRSLYGESLDISTEAEALELAKNMGLVVLSIDFKYNGNKDIYLPSTINSMQYKALQKFNDELSKLLLEKGRDSLLFKYHMDKKSNISGNLRNVISIYSSKIDNNRLYVEDINLSNYNLDGIRSNIVSNIFEGNITKTNDVVSVNDEILIDDIIEELDDIVITHNRGFAHAIKKLRSYVLFGITDGLNPLIKNFSRETVKKYLLKVLREVVVNVHNDFDLEEFYSYGFANKTGYLVVTSKQVVMIPSEIMLNMKIHFEDICEILFEDFDRNKYNDMSVLDIAKELGVVLVELHSNKSNVVYSPKTINAYQYKMLSKFNDQIKTIISNKFNERNIEFTLVGDNTKLFNQLDNLLEKIVIEDNEGSVSNSEVNLDLVDITNVEVNERISKVREILDSVFGRVNVELSDSVKNIIEYLKHRDSNSRLYESFRWGYSRKVGDFKVASLMNNNSWGFLAETDVDLYDRSLGKKIADLLDKGMTCDQIIKKLSFFERVKFKKFLRNTEKGRYLRKLTSEELFALKLWFSSDISAINKISADVRNRDIIGDKVIKLRDGRFSLSNIYMDLYDVIYNSKISNYNYMDLSDVIANLESAIEKFGGLKENMVLTNIVNIDSFMDVNGEYYEIFEQIQDKNDPFEVLAVLRSFVGVRFFDSSFVRLSNRGDFDNDKLPIEIEYIAPKGTSAVYLNGLLLFNRNVVSQIVDVDVVPNGNNGFGNYKGNYRIVVRCVVDVDTTNSNTKVEENKNADKFVEQEKKVTVISDNQLDEIEILAAMQARLNAMSENTDGKSLEDLKTEFEDIYHEIIAERIKVEEYDDFDDAVMSNGEDSVNLDIFDGLSEKMIEGASRLFDKSVSDLTVEDLKHYQIVVKTVDEILKAVPNGFFKDDIQREEFLYGVPGDVDTGSNYSAFDLRTKFLDAINNGSLVKVIDTFTKGKLDSLKVAGFYKIIYAINQFVEENGIVVEDGVLPIKQIAAKDPAYFEGGKDLVLSVLADNLKQAEDNRDRITGVLSEIATLNNGTLRGLDKALKSKDSASRKVYNSWLEALEDAGYTVESGNNVIEENGNIRLIGIKEFNKGQSFVITPDGTVMTADLKDYGVDKKGIVVNISFSDFIPKDLLRYTIISDTGNYMDTLLNTIRLLEENGYEIISSNLSWPGSFYKGVNLTLREKSTSQVFELQFHTDTSFYAKNEGTHDFYEVKRNKLYNDGEKSSSIQRVADYAQILVESNVEVPNGAEKLGVINKFVKYVLTSGKNIDLTKMNEIIAKVKEINSMYDSKTDIYKDSMKVLINSVSIEGKFSFGEFLSEYFKIDTISSMDGRIGVVSSEIVSDTDDSSWVEDEDFGIEEEDSDGYELKDGERLSGRIGMQFFGGTLNNNDSFDLQLPLFSKLIESVGNNDLFQQVLEQIKKLKESDLVGFKTLDEYKAYIIDYFISINFDGLTSEQIYLLTTDEIMLKKMMGTNEFNDFLIANILKSTDKIVAILYSLDVSLLNEMFNSHVIKDFILNLSVDDFLKIINIYLKKSNYSWLQCDIFIQKILNMNDEELYIFMKKTNFKKYTLICKVFDSGNYNQCLKLLHFIEDKFLNIDVLLNNPEYLGLLEDFYPSRSENREVSRMRDNLKKLDEEVKSEIITLLNDNSKNISISSNGRILNLDMHSVYIIKYELNGIIEQMDIKTRDNNYIDIYPEHSNSIKKSIVSGDYKLLSIQKDEVASRLCLSEEDGLFKGINKVSLNVNGIVKSVLVKFNGNECDIRSKFTDVSSVEIIDIQSIESKNVILEDYIGLYEATYDVDGILYKIYLTPTKKSFRDKNHFLDIDKYFIENNITDATDVQIRKVDIQELDFSSTNIYRYKSSYDIYVDGNYGGDQSDVRKIIVDFINNVEMDFVSLEKAETMVNIINKYFPNSTEMEIINLVSASEAHGCGYMAVANAFCTYMGNIENGLQKFKERFGYDLFIIENGKKYYNLEAIALDIFCYFNRDKDIKLFNDFSYTKSMSRVYMGLLDDYFLNKSIYVKRIEYDSDKFQIRNSLFAQILSSPKNAFNILISSNFDIELLPWKLDHSVSLNSFKSTGWIEKVFGGHAMLVTGVDDKENLTVSSWGRRCKFLIDSISKYEQEGKHAYADIVTIEFDIGE